MVIGWVWKKKAGSGLKQSQLIVLLLIINDEARAYIWPSNGTMDHKYGYLKKAGNHFAL